MDIPPIKGLDYSMGYLYSNKEWNKIYAGQQARFISLSTSNGPVSLRSMETAVMHSATKTYCSVSDANPNEAVQDPDRPVIGPEEPTVTSSETTLPHVCLTRDISPNGGRLWLERRPGFSNTNGPFHSTATIMC